MVISFFALCFSPFHSRKAKVRRKLGQSNIKGLSVLRNSRPMVGHGICIGLRALSNRQVREKLSAF